MKILMFLLVIMNPCVTLAANVDWQNNSFGLVEFLLVIGFFVFLLKEKMKTMKLPKNITKIGGTITGAIIGSSIGIAGFGTAISGLIPLAILGFYIGRNIDKERELANKER